MNKIILKIVLIGETGVGKTSIVNSYIYTKYNEYIDCTIGASFISKKMTINYCKGLNKIHEDDNYNKSKLDITLHIWDTAGQERYKSLVPLYYRNANILFQVNDITNTKSSHLIENTILEELQDDCLKVIIFNKMDLPNNHKIIEPNSDYIYKSVSAKNGTNIDDLFTSSINKYIIKNLKYILETTKKNNMIIDDNYIKSSCC